MKQVISVRILGPSLTNSFGGFACYAYVIRNKEGQLMHEACELAENPDNPSSTASSSTIATYTALIGALQWLIRHGFKDDIIIVKTSSKSLMSQLDDVGQCAHQSENKSDYLPKSIVPLYAKASKLKSRFYKFSFELVKSKGNADDYTTANIDEKKEIEELLVLAYVEAEEKTMKKSRIFAGQKSPFLTAAQLIKYGHAHA